ncbi:hypothetical protein QBC44DRAFT_374904 [Cladorrhinum sp. PSN332]|nr:hypothetical protein QBC44DRAFT_374904 [Cladorrhinum sp. PSN332]
MDSPTNSSLDHTLVVKQQVAQDRFQASGDNREQPWKKLVGGVEKVNKESPAGEDFFPCQNGFHAHSLAA